VAGDDFSPAAGLSSAHADTETNVTAHTSAAAHLIFMNPPGPMGDTVRAA
jgi:hypothetical protein